MKNRDFSLITYRNLLESCKINNYIFVPFNEYIRNKPKNVKSVILRHDVDKNPNNAFKMALLEKSLNIRSSYYFRILPKSYNIKIIKNIVELNHEIGYHYEDLSMAKGNFQIAIESFKNNLDTFRQLYPVETICMHGSPLSKWDNRSLWDKYQYQDFSVIGEPYFDLNFSKIFYLTDTGRSWNSSNNVRDFVNTTFHFNIDSTRDIFSLLDKGKLPNTIMLNIHPQRWTDNFILWTKEFVLQNIKNILKRYIIF